MANSSKLEATAALHTPAILRGTCSGLLGGLALMAALVAYCELCTLATDSSVSGLAVSALWALRVSFGWMLLGAALGALGPLIAASRVAATHPRWLFAACVVLSVILTLSAEALLTSLTTDEPFLARLLYERTPMVAVASTLLIVLYSVNRRGRSAAFHADAPGATAASQAMDAAALAASDCHVVAPPAAPLPRHLPSALSVLRESTLEVMTGTGRVTVRLEHVEYLQAEGNYINVMHSSGRTYLLRQTLTALERQLDPQQFVRIHRSTIVNRQLIEEQRCNGVLVLRSGHTVKVSRAFRKLPHQPLAPVVSDVRGSGPEQPRPE